jgi:hypothetical protein
MAESSPASAMPRPSVGMLRRKLDRFPLGPVDGTELSLRAYTYGKSSQTYGIFECSCGSSKILQCRYVFGRSKGTTRTTHCGAPAHPKTRWSPVLGYLAWHRWLAANQGKAREHPCQFCGDRSANNQWSYLHGAPDELFDLDGKDEGLAYVMNARWYIVLCKSCHATYDRAWASGSPPLLRWLHGVLGSHGER